LFEVELCVSIEDVLDKQGIVLEPLSHEGFEEGEEVHEVESVFEVDEDEVEVEAAHVADVLEELFYVRLL
jgi:hypothetical protein